jgi:hypothetical protein
MPTAHGAEVLITLRGREKQALDGVLKLGSCMMKDVIMHENYYA